MAFTLEDLLAKAKGIVPDNVNIFGAGIPANTKILQDAGLLNPEAVKKAEQQSLFQGLLGAGLGYLAQPKNQGYGSAIPYLAKAYGQGIVASQKPYEQLSQDAITKEKVDEILATRESKKVKQNLTNLLLQDPRVANDPAAKLMAIEKPETLYTQLNKPRESMFGKPSINDFTPASVKAAQESNDITKLVLNPKKPKEYEPTQLEKLISARDRLPAGDAKIEIYQSAIEKLIKSDTSTVTAPTKVTTNDVINTKTLLKNVFNLKDVQDEEVRIIAARANKLVAQEKISFDAAVEKVLNDSGAVVKNDTKSLLGFEYGGGNELKLKEQYQNKNSAKDEWSIKSL